MAVSTPIIWLYGLSGSGKSTLGSKFVEYLNIHNRADMIDGDDIRNILNIDLGFTREARFKQIETIRGVCSILMRNNIIPVVCAITPYEEMRIQNRNYFNNYMEVFVSASLEVCISRDVKGLYKKALEGEISNFTGISDPFECPKNPDLILDTHKSIDSCLSQLIGAFETKFKNNF